MSKDKFIDKITLGSGMSLIVGNKPEALCLGKMCGTKPNHEIDKFGFFESATPNFETYYPDIKNAEQIKPKDDEFIFPVFRMLSEVIVRKAYNPVDFSMNGVLKASMPKLLGQTVYPNHEALVGNELGAVSEVFWQDKYKAKNGILVPAGINAALKIDAISHPNVARKIQMDPPAIHSNSVTVEFEWERSHPGMDMDEFRSKMGTMGSDGQLVRRIASFIRNYHETSFVPHGADPYAQKVDENGKINNAEYADSVYSLSAQGKEKPSRYYFNNREDLISLNSNTPEENSLEDKSDNNQNKNEMKLKLTTAHAALLALFALSIKAGESSIEVELNEDNLNKLNEGLTSNGAIAAELSTTKTALTMANTKVTELTGQLATKTTEAEGLTTKVTELTAEVGTLSEALKPAVDKLREDTTKAYNLIKGDKADKVILSNIDKADFALLSSLHKTYTEELEAKFPSTCQDCQSTNISKASSKLGEKPLAGEKDGDGKIVLKDDAAVMEEFSKENANTKFYLDK